MTYPISRRQALVGALAASLSGSTLGGALNAATDRVDADTFAAYLDILLPGDDMSPSASAVGVDVELRQLAQGAPLFERLLALGTQWLNQTGRGPFHTLLLGDQGRVVDWMATADRDEIPGRFYELVRQSAVEFYYARPEAKAGFDMNTAPQPAGNPPPWP